MSGVAKRLGWLLTIAVCGVYTFSSNCAVAQITPDGTLPTNVQLNGSIFNITGGTQAGGNLFHSFREFSVPTGGGAFFNNAVDVQNIISRVTGGSISTIDGLIRANGTANLFLINPGGIVFGQNARLDVGGSFLGTTANAIQFGNQGIFSATNPNAPSLLTVNPSALLFNQLNPGAIANQGFLTARLGQSLVLAGGDINFNRGSMAVAGGRIELAAIAGTGTVGLNADNSLSIPTDLPRADIALSNSQIGVSAGNNSGVAIHARNLDISGNSLIRSSIGLGVGAVAGDILIDARDRVTFDGARGRASAVSQVGADATGQGGNITINTESLLVDNGARIGAVTSGQGDAGNVIINAREQVVLDNRAQIGAVTSGQGNTGNIIINAREQVTLNNSAAILNNVQGGSGKGGDIRVNTGTLTGTNLGVLQAVTIGQGNAGNVIINARDRIEFAGRSDDGQLRSGAVSLVQPGAVGNSGNIEITTGSLFVRDGAALNASTEGNGSAGNVIINARDGITFDGGNVFSGLASRSAVGQGGNVLITTSSLELFNGSQIDVSTFGNGNAGNVVIVAKQPIIVAGTGNNARSSAIFSTTGDNPFIPGTGPTIVGTGKGGNITITAPQLKVSDGAVIDARTFNDKPGGNIDLTLGTLQLLNGGQIFTTSESSGSAGTITITAEQETLIAGTDATFFSRLNQFPNRIVQISPYSSLSVRSAATGAAGNIILNTPRLTLADQGTINAASNAVDGGNVTLNSNLLLLRRNSSISATAGLIQGAGNGGNITINTPNGFIIAVPNEDSDITANAFTGRGGRVDITTSGIFGIQPRLRETPLSDITASSEFGVSGDLTINTSPVDFGLGLVELPASLADAGALISSSCNAFDDTTGSNFTVTGRGGLPPSPDEPLTNDIIWTDTRVPTITAPQPETADLPSPKNNAVEVTPATGWVFNGKGEVTLISASNTATLGNTNAACGELK